jgi:NTE family protein
MPSRQTLLRETHITSERPPFERIALVLQGGGALGAYQGGVYLAEANLHPDWVAGVRFGQARLQGPSAHATARLRLRAGQ